jgi:alpha-L-fucosidase
MLGPLQRWFGETRWGLFIQWGVAALYERGEDVLLRERLAPSAYRQRAASFQPAQYRPAEWAELACAAGMRYAVLTAKGQDGTCLFASAHAAGNSVDLGAGRDGVAEYVSAFRQAGLRVGLSYALADWGEPAYWQGPSADPEAFAGMVERMHAQVGEVCRNYGPIDLLRFEGDWPHGPEACRAQELVATVRHLQPGIVIHVCSGPSGDYATVACGAAPPAGPWEARMLATERWGGYHAGDRRWKTADEVIRRLAQVSAGGGNLLLTVGPRADGSLPPSCADLLREVGQWLALNGQAVHETERGSGSYGTHGAICLAEHTVYLHVLYWPGNTLHLAGMTQRVLGATYLADNWPIDFRQEGEHLYLEGLPAYPPDPRDTVIALHTEGASQSTEIASSLEQGDAQRMARWARS